MESKRKPGAKDPSTITSEYIAEKRRERELKKQQKRDELVKQGIDPDAKPVPEHLQFIKRPMLDIPGQKASGDGLIIKVLTYNILAQALIRRKLFPTSGSALKWANRSQRLGSEIEHYDADIVCLQELDFDQYNSHWKKEFERMGYSSRYHRSGVKRHGVAILYKHSMFHFEHHYFIDYDGTETPGVPASTKTQNIGLLVYLKLNEDVKKKNPGITKDGIIIGTTHLFWHPFGTFERTRQTYLVLHHVKEFSKMMHLLYPNDRFYRFFAGDFNAQPYDSPYLSITSKPITYTERPKVVLGKAASHKWNDSDAAEDEDDDEDDDEEDTPEPSSFNFTPAILEKIQHMESLHNNIDMRFISLYSVAYRQVHPENTIPSDRYEPSFSNWAHTWRGLLDYIFVATDWNGDNANGEVDSVQQLEQNQNIRLLSLLRLPTPEEMGPEPSGQPRDGQYPSDHLCLMAQLELR
ncbi:hypothetical protein CA3LBN_000089 [Candidozyma haemuli]|uniref:Endonuclease/exonuclease/phosphatase domain-containing protein n=1 Tax=Candidozyma haemuli TaxID=45357 RepID=A0ABX8I525_9ASCO|nr:hypothetical protein CA3LBN_000089 [[Candida] haemuloni]